MTPASDTRPESAALDAARLRTATVLTGVGLALLIGTAWLNGLDGPPMFDDDMLMGTGRCFTDGDQLRRTLRFAANDSCAYRPVRYWTFWLDLQLFGDTFRAHKIGNVVWHVFAAWAALALATLVGRRSGLAPGTALALGAAVALLWAVHPIHPDSVTYVSGRRDITVGLFSMLALYAAIRAEDGARAWWAAAAAATVLAMLSKEVAVTIPALWAAWRWSRGSLRDDLRHPVLRTALAVGAAAALGLFLWRGVFRPYVHEGMLWGDSVLQHYLTVLPLQTLALRHGLGLAPLIGDYHPDHVPFVTSPLDPRVLGTLALIGALLTLAVRLRPHVPLASWGILFWFIAYAPSAQIVPHHVLFAEHYLYLPLFGLALAVGAGLHAAARHLARTDDARRRARLALIVLTITASGWHTLRVMDRNLDWLSMTAYYAVALERAPTNRRIPFRYASVLHVDGHHHEAVPRLRRYIDAFPQDTRRDRDVLSALLGSAEAIGDTETYRQAAERLLARHPNDPLAHRAMAQAALDRGDLPLALRFTASWADLEPDSPEPVLARATVLHVLERHDEAAALILPLDPDTLDDWGRSMRCQILGAAGADAPGCPP